MYQGPYGDQEPGQAYYEDVPPGHTQPYPPPPASLRLSEPAPAPRRGVPWLAVACCLVSIASLLLAAWVLSMFQSYKGTVAAQIRQVQQAQQKADRAASGNTRSISGLAGQVSGMDSTLNAIAQFSTVCSQYLTGPNGGPTTFYFPCTLQKP